MALTSGGGGVSSRGIRPIGAVRLDRAEGIAEPLCAVGGVTSRFQEVTQAQGRVYNSVAEGGAILRREVQRLVQSETFPGEGIKGVVNLRRVVLDGDPEIGGEELVSEH